mmetsp:Transcript_87314/g.151139  ORF Transcript_87314/g.151139 Transcript_87314/m.151139 type:complete len:189 (+) Transcript_87314:51-617(+)
MSASAGRARGRGSVTVKGSGRGAQTQTTTETLPGTNIHTFGQARARGHRGSARGRGPYSRGKGSSTTSSAAAPPESAKPCTEETAGTEQLTFGQHVGETFEEVLQNDPGYCAWAIEQSHPSPALARFVAYLRQHQAGTSAARASSAASGPEAAATGETASSAAPMNETGAPDMDAIRAMRIARLSGNG